MGPSTWAAYPTVQRCPISLQILQYLQLLLLIFSGISGSSGSSGNSGIHGFSGIIAIIFFSGNIMEIIAIFFGWHGGIAIINFEEKNIARMNFKEK